MRIAVLSGKGGTGKTTVAASIAASLPKCQYVDCDAEEPNGALFLRPVITEIAPVEVAVPAVNQTACTGCGVCAAVCRFNALAAVGGKVLVFEEICRHCGACGIACPEGAIHEVMKRVGVVEADETGSFLQGRLDVGEFIAVPVIDALKKRLRDDVPVILDGAPGASCPVVRTIEGCDYCILVAEPTPFGLHDLRFAAQVVRKTGIPMGVVINKATKNDTSVRDYCAEQGLPVLFEIPYSVKIARAYSGGLLPAQVSREWKARFQELYETVERSVCV